MYMGIDGGGTKTDAAAVDETGRVICTIRGGSTNPYAVSFAEATRELADLLDLLLAQQPVSHLLCSGICLGMSGVGNDEEKRAMTEFLRKFQHERSLSFPIAMKTEAEISLMAALDREYGILVISGTGSIAYAITPEGHNFRTGGWGHYLGDEGSGYQIGLLTLKAVMKSHHAIIPPTMLTDLIIEDFGFKQITDLKGYVYQSSVGKPEIAAFAQYCIRAAAAGDRIASGIIRTQAEEFIETTTALIGHHSSLEHATVVLNGSVFQHSQLFRETFCEALSERFPHLAFSQGGSGKSPAVGAALLARKLFG